MGGRLDILLLGGSGFLGSAFLRAVAARPTGSVRVRALLRRPSAIPDYPFLDKVAGHLEAPPRGLEPRRSYVLVNLAVKQLDHDGRGYLATNVEATARLLDSLGPRLSAILYGSSMSVYGQGAQEGVTEATPLAPATPLSESRALAERRIEAFARRRGASSWMLRPRFVLGAGDRFVLPGLARLVQRRVRLASGAQRFSVIDVDDYAALLVQLAEREARARRAPTSSHGALNVGHARPVTFAEIAEALEAALDLAPARFALPVSPRMTRALRRVPWSAAEALATRIELVGFSHWGDTRALAAAVGDAIIGKDPRLSVRRAAAMLAPSSRSPS